MKKILFFAIIVALAVGAWVYFGGRKDVAKGGFRRDVAVSVINVSGREIAHRVELSGRVAALRMAEIRPRVSGVVKKIHFVEGGMVRKGQQLYQIDDAAFLANLAAAKADLAASRANFSALERKYLRYEKLLRVEAVSKQEFDEIKADFESAKADILVKKAALDNALIELGYTKVFAPISGKIGKSFVTEGALVTKDQAKNLAVVTYLDEVFVDISQVGVDFIALREKFAQDDITVALKIPNYDGDFSAIGHLNFAESIVDEGTGAVLMRAVFDNKDKVLMPGLFVRVVLDLGMREAILLPQNVVQIGLDGKMRVFVVENGVAKLREVVVGDAADGDWVIEEGLKVGDVVVADGFLKIRDGGKVVVRGSEGTQKRSVAKGEEHPVQKVDKEVAEGARRPVQAVSKKVTKNAKNPVQASNEAQKNVKNLKKTQKNEKKLEKSRKNEEKLKKAEKNVTVVPSPVVDEKKSKVLKKDFEKKEAKNVTQKTGHPTQLNKEKPLPSKKNEEHPALLIDEAKKGRSEALDEVRKANSNLEDASEGVFDEMDVEKGKKTLENEENLTEGTRRPVQADELPVQAKKAENSPVQTEKTSKNPEKTLEKSEKDQKNSEKSQKIPKNPEKTSKKVNIDEALKEPAVGYDRAIEKMIDSKIKESRKDFAKQNKEG